MGGVINGLDNLEMEKVKKLLSSNDKIVKQPNLQDQMQKARSVARAVKQPNLQDQMQKARSVARAAGTQAGALEQEAARKALAQSDKFKSTNKKPTAGLIGSISRIITKNPKSKKRFGKFYNFLGKK